MPVVYLKHPVHGEKVAFSEVEVKADQENGWVEFDPTGKTEEAPAASEVTPPVPSFLAPVESDLPDDFPGREHLIAAGHTTWAGVADLNREELIALKGIGEKTADAILKVMNG